MSSGNELDPDKETTWSEYDAEEDPSPPSLSSQLLMDQYYDQEKDASWSDFDETEYWTDIGIMDDPDRLNHALFEEIENITICLLNKIN